LSTWWSTCLNSIEMNEPGYFTLAAESCQMNMHKSWANIE